MKNQNKVLMSLLTASISALAAAPALAAEDASKTSIIDVGQVLQNQGLNEELLEAKKDIKSQVDAMLSKKAPIMKISESINIVVDNYGNGDSNIKQQVFEDLKLGVFGTQDSTNVNPGIATSTVGGTTTACHAICHTACHGVCHGACHGARGWR